jgi:hypothetical protein
MVIQETDTDNFARVMELARALAHHVEDRDPGGSAEGIRIAAGDPHPVLLESRARSHSSHKMISLFGNATPQELRKQQQIVRKTARDSRANNRPEPSTCPPGAYLVVDGFGIRRFTPAC